MTGTSSQPQNSPLISVVLVSYKNFDSTIGPCLRSLLNLGEFADLQIIIVDNASGKETTDKIKELTKNKANIEFIPNKTNRGFPGGANDGSRQASADIIFFLDIDTIVPNGALRKLAGFIEENPDWIVGPVTNQTGSEQKIFTETKEPEKILLEGAQWCKHAQDSVIKVRQLDFSCIGMKRKILEDVGSLDEGFGLGYYEDTDFCHRAVQKGYPLMMIEEVFFFHKGGGTGLSSKDKLRESRKFFLKKHGKEAHASLLRQRDVNLRAINCYAHMMEYAPVKKEDILYRAKNRLHLAENLWPKNPIKKLLYSRKLQAAQINLRQLGLNLPA